MTIGGDGNEEPVIVSGDEVERVTQFNFLGSLITPRGGCLVERRRRLAMAKSAMVGRIRSTLIEALPKQPKSA